MKVEDNGLWDKMIEKGVLQWLCYAITDVGVTAIGALSNLEVSNISSCSNVTTVGIQNLIKLTKLQSLNIRWCESIDSVGLVTIVNGFPQLKLLDICGLYRMNDSGLTDIVPGKLPNLISLSIQNSNIGDGGVVLIATGAPALTSLNISECDKITDTGLHVAATKLKQLKLLKMKKCDNITDVGITIAFANDNLSQLQSLVMSWCRHITDVSLIAIASRKLIYLQLLSIRVCGNVTDKGVVAIANGLKNLQVLEMSASNVTEAGLHALGEKLPQLKLRRY